MIYAFDTYYQEKQAKTVAVGFENWTDSEVAKIFTKIMNEANEYKSGLFYERELPCIMDLLEEMNLEEVSCIVVDGYVVLDDEGKLGLGGYLYEKLGKKIPIIGVAKNQFGKGFNSVIEVLRGESSKALHVTSLGVKVEAAADHIRQMHGAFRMPTVLKLLDMETRKVEGE